MEPQSEDERLGRVRARVDEAARLEGCEVVDLSMHLTGSRPTLTVTVDRAGGITVGECARVSRRLGTLLESDELIERAYTLEVSSPGLTRALSTPQDYQRFSRRLALIQTRVPVDGKTRLRGVLEGLSGSTVVRLREETSGATVEIPLEAIAWGRLDFDLAAPAVSRPRPTGRSKRPAGQAS